MNPKVVFVVLAVIGVVFVVGVGMGIFGDDGGSDALEKWTKRLEGWDFSWGSSASPVIDEKSIELSEQTAQRRIAVEASQQASRELKLKVSQPGQEVSVTWQAEPQQMEEGAGKLPPLKFGPQQFTLSDDQEVTIKILKEGGTLTLDFVQGTGEPPAATVLVE